MKLKGAKDLKLKIFHAAKQTPQDHVGKSRPRHQGGEWNKKTHVETSNHYGGKTTGTKTGSDT